MKSESDEAIKTLNEIIDEGWLISDMEKCTAIDACEFAIDRIRRYQKIQEIMESDTYKGIFTYSDDTRLNHIREVLENDE